MAKKISFDDEDIAANPFAFSAPNITAPVQAPVDVRNIAEELYFRLNPNEENATAQALGISQPGMVRPRGLSEDQGYGMVPVYERGTLQGYQFNPVQAGLGVTDTAKPPAILAAEKQLGRELEPIYETARSAGDPRGRETINYGPPIGYRYDNGQGQYVNFDPQGNYGYTQTRDEGSAAALGILGAAALPFILPSLGIGTGSGLLSETAALGSGQVAATTPLAFTPEMIASGAFTPGSIGAAGAASGALTGAELAAAYGAGGGLLTDLAPLTAVPETVTSPISEVIAETVPKTVAPSINEMIASGTFTPGSAGAYGAASGALTGAELAAAGGLLTQGATPALVEMAAQGAKNYLESTPSISDSFKLPSLSNIKDAVTIGSIVGGAVGAGNAPEPPAFKMAPYVPPSGRPYENIAMSPIAAPYTPTRIAGQYDPTMTPGGMSPYELIMSQMRAPVNPYANFEAGTAIGGYNPQLGLLS